MEITLTEQNFASEVLQAKGTVLVDFWATWCGPCRMIAPELEQLSAQTGVTIGKVNVDEQPELANRYGIVSIPTIMIFKEGKLAETVVGYRSKSQLAMLI